MKPDTLKVDWQKLLAPVSPENPAGSLLRYEGAYDRVRDARREDDPRLDQGVWKIDLKRANWETVGEICATALQTRSKDLQLAAWLMEAWLQIHGFAGIKNGLVLILRLCEEFWDTIHPQIEEQDLGPRLGPLHWLDDKMTLRLKFIPISAPASKDAAHYSFADWESATQNENLLRKGQLNTEGDSPAFLTHAKFFLGCTLTPKEFYSELSEDIRDCLQNLTALQDFLDEKCGRESPSLFHFKKTLEAIQQLINSTIKPRIGVTEPPPAEKTIKRVKKTMDKPTTSATDTAAPGAITDTADIKNRAHAYQLLEKAADYLLLTEPHSPTPYLVKRAVSWGNMPLDEVLREIVRDENDLRVIFELLGLKGLSA